MIIGTHGDDLAIRQANYTKELLEQKGYSAKLKVISIAVDHSPRQQAQLQHQERQSDYTKALESALLSNEIDVAVHSYKDLLPENVTGLIIAGVSSREDPSEILIVRRENVDEREKFKLKKNAVVGTSSDRQRSQLLAFRPDVQLKDLTRAAPEEIKALRFGEYDAILMALSDFYCLHLNLDDLHTEIISPHEIVPAAAQGVLAWQTRATDYETIKAIGKINEEDAQHLCSLEKKVMALVGPECQLALGVLCENDVDEEGKNIWRFTVSKTDKWNNQPLQLKMVTHHPHDFPEKIVEHLNKITPRKVFVTKVFRHGDYLPKALRKIGFWAEGKSLIEFKQITIKEIPKTDWIFFSNKHAVKYFFRQQPETGNAKIGCVGKAIAQELRNFGRRADFIGQSTDTRLIGKQFSSLVGKSKVLFPAAKESTQNIQHQLINKNCAINLAVYTTIKHAYKMPEQIDIVVFTSPANVDAFFESNKWSTANKAVAMGEATGKALLRKGVKKFALPYSFDDLGLFQAILSLSD